MCLHWRIFVLVQGLGLAPGAHGSCTVLEGLSSTTSPRLARGRCGRHLGKVVKALQLVLRLIRMRINVSSCAGKEPRISFQNAQNNYDRHS